MNPNLIPPYPTDFGEVAAPGQTSATNNGGGAYNPDPWAHRSSRMLCKTCMWYVAKVADPNRPAGVGRCRRHAPVITGYPVVFERDWCGDHKLDENK